MQALKQKSMRILPITSPSRIYESETVWNVILGAWQTSSDSMYLEKNIKFHQIFETWEKYIKIFEHSSPHPFLQAPLHICVICPNPSLGCLPPQSNRRQCSRLCSVLWCIIFLQHVLCPNPSLGCLPPKSDRRQCSRLCSVLLCIIFL